MKEESNEFSGIRNTKQSAEKSFGYKSPERVGSRDPSRSPQNLEGPRAADQQGQTLLCEAMNLPGSHWGKASESGSRPSNKITKEEGFRSALNQKQLKDTSAIASSQGYSPKTVENQRKASIARQSSEFDITDRAEQQTNEISPSNWSLNHLDRNARREAFLRSQGHYTGTSARSRQRNSSISGANAWAGNDRLQGENAAMHQEPQSRALESSTGGREWPQLGRRNRPETTDFPPSREALQDHSSDRNWLGNFGDQGSRYVGLDKEFDTDHNIREPTEEFDEMGTTPEQSRKPDRPCRFSGRFDAGSRTYDASPKSRSREDKSRRASKSNFEDDERGFDLEDDIDEMGITSKKARKKNKKRDKNSSQDVPRPKSIELPPFISVSNLATALRARQEDFISKLEELGFEDVAVDHVLNAENAGLVAMEYDFEPIPDQSDVRDLKARPEPTTDRMLLPSRPPVVTIMGHVDHGKTTILDFLRKSSVAASEFGGITQHIGAFIVPMAPGKLVTFLDTPGHSAFLAMRQRGANVTDIVILVVAADDSVKPQTVEALRHARNAKVPIIVAINKVDKDEADADRVKKDLLSYDLAVEDFGGDVQSVEVSGRTGKGLSDLEEAITTLAELLDLRAEVDGPVEGWVLEGTTKKAGRIATVLVRRGTIRIGDVIVAGTTWARVRSLHNEAGMTVPAVGPGTPVEIDGWRDQPSAGDEVLQAPDEDKATDVVAYRSEKAERQQANTDMETINENRRIEAERRIKEKEAATAARTAAKESRFNKRLVTAAIRDAKEVATQEFYSTINQDVTSAHGKGCGPTKLFLIVKADVFGSAEAVGSALSSIPLANQPVELSILRTGVGPVSENDVDLASAVVSSTSPAATGSPTAIIISFNQDTPPSQAIEAERLGIRIFNERIIYKVIDSTREIIESHLPPIVEHSVTGEAECLQAFEIKTSAAGKKANIRVAGCRVKNGSLERNSKVKVFRGGVGAEIVYEGSLSSLKNVKKDVSEMRKGTECGVGFDGWERFQAGDTIQCLEERKLARKLPA